MKTSSIAEYRYRIRRERERERRKNGEREERERRATIPHCTAELPHLLISPDVTRRVTRRLIR